MLALSFGLNARVAANPRSAYQSADERSYGKLAVDIVDNHALRRSVDEDERAAALAARARRCCSRSGYKLFGSDGDAKTLDIRAAYWEQALITTGTTALAFALAFLLAGPWAGLLAGAIVGTYPPLIGATGDQLSEPLGRVPAAGRVRRRSRWRSSKARAVVVRARSGALFGLTILTRTDLLPVPFLIAGHRRADRADPARARCVRRSCAAGMAGDRRRGRARAVDALRLRARRAASSPSPRAARRRCSSAPTCRAAARRSG